MATQMSSSTTPPETSPPGIWTTDVSPQEDAPIFTWSVHEEHWMETLNAQGFWLQTEGAGGGVKSEYREWQFNQDSKRFIPRIASSAGGTSRSYPKFTCMHAYELFKRHDRSVPRWIVDLTRDRYSEDLKWTLRPNALRFYSQKPTVSSRMNELRERSELI